MIPPSAPATPVHAGGESGSGYVAVVGVAVAVSAQTVPILGGVSVRNLRWSWEGAYCGSGDGHRVCFAVWRLNIY